MKRNLLLTALFSVIFSSALFAQLSIENASFETPADGLKYRADGDGVTVPAFNGAVTGWWADVNATDCGRHQSSKGGYDGLVSGYAYNNDNGGSIWALAGTVEAGKLDLSVSFYAKKSYSFAAGATPTNLILKFAEYEGSDPSLFQLIGSLKQLVVDENSPWVKYDYSYSLPASTVGKKLLIGFDVETEALEGVWYLFDNFSLSVSSTTGFKNSADKKELIVFPNPASDFLTIQTENNLLNKYAFYNVGGKKVLSGIVDQNGLIDVRKMDKGIYFLKVENSNGSKVIKVTLK